MRSTRISSWRHLTNELPKKVIDSDWVNRISLTDNAIRLWRSHAENHLYIYFFSNVINEDPLKRKCINGPKGIEFEMEQLKICKWCWPIGWWSESKYALATSRCWPIRWWSVSIHRDLKMLTNWMVEEWYFLYSWIETRNELRKLVNTNMNDTHQREESSFCN